MQSIFKCPSCTGEMDIISDGLGQCSYCGSKHPLPKSFESQLNRANKLRQEEMRFDEALDLYKQIVSEDADELEAHWGAVLCRFGIEYVEDEPRRFKPTCHRTMETSIFEDVDYRIICEKASPEQMEIYGEQAKMIDTIQRKILAFQTTADPYDIFLSLKVTDDNGNKTVEREIAMRLYDQLSDKYRVFFSEVSLKSEYAGEDYEAVIYSALRSSKVMVLIADNVYNMKAKWVRNEWSRYLRMLNSDKEKKIICLVRKDMIDDDQFPIEFAAKEHLFIGDIGYETDLLHNIDAYFKRIRKSSDTGKSSVKGDLVGERDRNIILAENAFRQKDFERAKQAAHEATVQDADFAKAYWYRLLATVECGPDDIIKAKVDLTQYEDFDICCKYASKDEKKEYIRISEECQRNLKTQENYDKEYNDILTGIRKHDNDVKKISNKMEHGSQMAQDRVRKLDSDFIWALIGLIVVVVFLCIMFWGEIFGLESNQMMITLLTEFVISSVCLVVLINYNFMDGLWGWIDIIKYSIVAIVGRFIFIAVAVSVTKSDFWGLILEILIGLYFLFIAGKGIFWISRGEKGKKMNLAGAQEYDQLKEKILGKSRERLKELNEKYTKKSIELQGSVTMHNDEDLESYFDDRYQAENE